MSNLQFDVDSKISTLTNPGGHLNRDTSLGALTATNSESGTIAVLAQAANVLDFDTGVTDSTDFFTVAAGVTTVVQTGTYHVDYSVMISADAVTGVDAIASVQLNGTDVTGSLSRMLVATTIIDDIVTLTGSITFTADEADTVQINVDNSGGTSVMTVETGSSYQISIA